jgi:hypothetical protein
MDFVTAKIFLIWVIRGFREMLVNQNQPVAFSASNSAISVQLRQKMLKDFELLGLQSRSFIW